MEALSRINGRAIPFGAKNVDTDISIPAKWLKTITREGLGEGAFETIRANEGESAARDALADVERLSDARVLDDLVVVDVEGVVRSRRASVGEIGAVVVAKYSTGMAVAAMCDTRT